MDVFGAAAKGGFVIAPFNVRLSANEVEYLINNSEAGTLFVGVELAQMVEALKPKISKVKHFIGLEQPLPDMGSESDLIAKYGRDERMRESTKRIHFSYVIRAELPASARCTLYPRARSRGYPVPQHGGANWS